MTALRNTPGRPISEATSEIQELYHQAIRARENAHCPYSGHHVGASLRTRGGKVFSGCNVENSSYGATVCAERTAIGSAVGASGRVEIVDILVVTDAVLPWPPCGMCRQVIAEFGGPATRVHLANLNNLHWTIAFIDLFPHAFTADHLSKP